MQESLSNLLVDYAKAFDAVIVKKYYFTMSSTLGSEINLLGKLFETIDICIETGWGQGPVLRDFITSVAYSYTRPNVGLQHIKIKMAKIHVYWKSKY